MIGTLVDAGDDWAGLEAAQGRVDFPLAAVARLEVTERAPAGGRNPSGRTARWSARLRELVVETTLRGDGQPMEVGDRVGGMVRGTLRAVAADHLYVATEEAEVFVPLEAVSYVAAGGR